MKTAAVGIQEDDMRLAIGGVVLCGIFCWGVAAKQAVPSASGTQAKQVVVLELMLGDKTPARISVPDGGAARITVKGKQRLGLLPVLKDGNLDVELVEYVKDATTGQDTTRALRHVTIAPGQRGRFQEGVVPIDVQWLDTTSPEFSSQSAPAPSPTTTDSGTDAWLMSPPGGCGECCITCGEFKVCACGVGTSCGACCCGTCCGAAPAPAASLCTKP